MGAGADLDVAGFIFVLFFKMSLKFVSSIEKHLNKKLQEILNTNNLFPFVNFSSTFPNIS